jgi:hypothetical protein
VSRDTAPRRLLRPLTRRPQALGTGRPQADRTPCAHKSPCGPCSEAAPRVQTVCVCRVSCVCVCVCRVCVCVCVCVVCVCVRVALVAKLRLAYKPHREYAHIGGMPWLHSTYKPCHAAWITCQHVPPLSIRVIADGRACSEALAWLGASHEAAGRDPEELYRAGADRDEAYAKVCLAAW